MWPSLEGRRFVVQIFGREPEVLARAAGMAAEIGASILDINMGCPAKKVTAGACGSALMREPALAASLVAAVRRVLPDSMPVTVKHRAGWDESSLNAATFARQMVEAGAAMITVHGRTRAQGFSGSVRLGPIAAVRAALPREIPVIGNGDVKDLAAYVRMKQETGCDGVMIGRGVMGNPWLFRSLVAYEKGEPDPGPPTLVERHTVWRRHVELVLAYGAPRIRIHDIRKTLAWYTRGLFGGASVRQQAFELDDVAALQSLGERFFERLASRAAWAAERAQSEDLLTSPADPVAKSIARKTRRTGAGHAEADEALALVVGPS
jgi:nifR3 family TIM-barrel protein